MTSPSSYRLPKEESVRLRRSLIGKNVQLFYKHEPLKIVRAHGQYMYDEQGTEYLDCLNNVAHVGHCHPHVVAAGSHQMSLLCTNNRFLHDNILLVSQKLRETLPKELCVFYFVNSGSEANDLAMRLARAHTGAIDTICLDHAYHGHVISQIDVSPYKFNNTGGAGKPENTHVAPVPDAYRGIFRDMDHVGEDLGALYASEVDKLIAGIHKKGHDVCAYIAESMQSCGGQVIPPKGYFQNVYNSIRKAGGVCIADEVQVGFGRVGNHMWSFQCDDVVPDIVTMGKPMGNGHPVACVATTQAIADSFSDQGMEYFNTCGGNPVSGAIALAVLEAIDNDHLLQNATQIGAYVMEKCRELQNKHYIIGDIRGRGMFLGIDLVKDRITREPDTLGTKYVVNRLREERVLLRSDGPFNNILKFKPPMCFNLKDADRMIATLDKIFTEMEDISTVHKYNADIEEREKHHFQPTSQISVNPASKSKL